MNVSGLAQSDNQNTNQKYNAKIYMSILYND